MLFYRLILDGFKKELTKEDMWQIEEKETCRILTEQLEKEWLDISEK